MEVCKSGQWKTVCNRGWSKEEAHVQVVCRQMGFAEDSRGERLAVQISTLTILALNFTGYNMQIIIVMIADQVIWATRGFGNANSSQATIGRIWWCSGSE